MAEAERARARWWGAASAILLGSACHGAPPPIGWDGGTDPAAGCAVGFQMANRYLGDAFTLHVIPTDANNRRVVLLPYSDGDSALWNFEAVPGTEPATYHVRNAAFRGERLANNLEMVRDTEDVEAEWFVEPVEDTLEAEGALYRFRASNNPGYALTAKSAPPFGLSIGSCCGNALLHWRLTSYYHCPSQPTE